MKNTDLYFITDVETRSKVDLQVVGARNYFNDPSTDIMYLGFKTKGLKKINISILVQPDGTIDYDLLNEKLKPYIGYKIVAHNYKFEFYAFSMLIRRGHLTGAVADWLGNIENYHCTKATAQRFGHGRSSLDALSFNLKLKTGKLKSGLELIKKYSIPNKNGEFNIITPENNIKWIEYLEGDILATEEIFNLLPRLENDKHEWPVFQWNKKLNQRGIQTDIKNVKILNQAYLKNIDKAEKTAVKYGLQKSGKLTISSSTGLKKLLNEKYDLELADVQEKTLNQVYDAAKNNKQLKEIIELRRLLQAKAPKKLDKFITLTDKKGIYFDVLDYHGTQPTGRWSGYGVQVHNFPRIVTKDFDNDLQLIQKGKDINIGSMLRGLLIPRKGHKFLVGDFSSIELIVLAWVVGCERILENARKGIKEYNVFGKKIYGREINKGSIEYNTSKTAVLNLGYGGGNKAPTFTFRGILEKNGIYDIPDIQIDHIIKLYRNTYFEVPEYWRNVENACIQAVLNKDQKKVIGKITFLFTGRALRVFLPSGRTLYYFNPKLKQGLYGPKLELAGQMVWGGVLTAHIVSSIARDILVQAVLKCEDAGLNPVLTVHDEIVNEIKNKDLKVAEKKFTEIMNFIPEWCKELPISAEIGIMERYGKL